MKRSFSLVLVILSVLAFALSGCGGGTGNTNDTDTNNDAEIEVTLQKEIEELPQETLDLLWGSVENAITVSVSDNEIYIYAKTTLDYYIPIVAEAVSEIALRNAEKTGYAVEISIQHYDVIAGDVGATWHSTNGIDGVFVSLDGDAAKVKYSIDDMYEYYSEPIKDWQARQ